MSEIVVEGMTPCVGGVEDRYGLAPIQQSILLESIESSDSRIGLWQLIWELREPLEVSSFRAAWQRLTDRHPIFRTCFRAEGLAEPYQEVQREAELPFESVDWSDLSSGEQKTRYAGWLEGDREKGLVLDQAPLIRATVLCFTLKHFIVVLTVHHGLFDGRTIFAAFKEVIAFYEAFRRGEDLLLPPPGSYRSYIEWLATRDRGRAEIFWRQSLQGMMESSPLEAGRPLGADAEETRRDLRNRAFGNFTDRLSEDQTSAMVVFARQREITLNTMLVGAWILILSRYGNYRDAAVGVVRTNRSIVPNGDSILGPMMNSMPFRAAVDPRTSLISWLDTLRAHWLAMRAADFVSLEDVRQWGGVPPETPLFESLVLFERHSMTDLMHGLGGAWAGRSFEILRQPTVPLSVYGYQDVCFKIEIVYDRQRFDWTTIQRAIEHLKNLLTAMSAATGTLADLPLLRSAEQHQLIVEWNDTTVSDAQGGSARQYVHQLFADNAQRRPDAVALEEASVSWTYRRLDERSSQLAHLLREMGVGVESVVGVWLRRSISEVLARLAILKAGGAYLPLDVVIPPDRVSFMLRDAKARVVLTKSHLAEALSLPGARVLCLDQQTDALDPRPTAPPLTPVPGAHPAYMIYTSGSSGRPKGVVLTHRGLANLVAWHLRAFRVSTEDRATRLAGLAFDASVWELWPYLSAGATVVIPPDETLAAPETLRDWLVCCRLTLGFVPTPVAEQLLTLDWPKEAGPRRVLTGGDTLHVHPSSSVPFVLINNYGPTENTVVTTAGRVTVGPTGVPGIGRPIDDVRVYLVCSAGSPSPVGARGELCIAGTSLARGYFDNPRLTAESFVPCPFAGRGERMYLTGDLARFVPGGSIDFQGRRDQQVKVRGFRIELEEIESVLNRHPAVDGCAVIIRTGRRTGDEQLVAFVVDVGQVAEDDQKLRSFLLETLPYYMVPSVFESIESLPLTTNGKVNRRALREAARAINIDSPDFAPPRTATEKILAQVWAEALEREKVGVHDDFFELGGHSLKAIQLISFVREIFRCEMSIGLLFQEPTISRLNTALFPSEQERSQAEKIAELTLDLFQLPAHEVDDIMPEHEETR